MKRLLAFLLLLTPAVLVAQSSLPPAPYANTQLEDPEKEREATQLMETIRCLVCQSQSIADSNAELASDMRSAIRQRIAAGETPEHIRAWLVQRYGDWVSYEPRADPVNWPLYAAPILLLVAGAGIALGRIKRRNGKARQA